MSSFDAFVRSVCLVGRHRKTANRYKYDVIGLYRRCGVIQVPGSWVR